MSPLPLYRFGLLALAAALTSGAAAGELPPHSDYPRHEQYLKAIDALGENPHVTVATIGTSVGGRAIKAITLGGPQADRRPAVLVVGGVDAEHLAGAQIAFQIASTLAERADNDDFLPRTTFYIVPRLNPDGLEKCFARPVVSPAGNDRPTDDDRDHQQGEDPANDLNGDGLITMLRVRDEAGDYVPHSDDPRVMIRIDRSKNERGLYRLLGEGVDDDHDDSFNEDGSGGVDINRNFPFDYRHFGQHSGDHAASEPETRALIDFAFDRPNIALVLVLGLEDNVLHPWKVNRNAEGARIKTTLLSGDEAEQKHLIELFKKHTKLKGSPPSYEASGSLAGWSYFHFGRPTLASRGWWIPPVEAEKDNANKADDKPDDESPDDAETNQPAEKESDDKGNSERPDESSDTSAPNVSPEPAADEEATAAQVDRGAGNSGQQPEAAEAADSIEPGDRGSDDLNALRWFAQQNLEGFVDWQPVDVEAFAGKQVEVGGFKPLMRLNPEPALLQPVAENQVDFLLAAVALLPRLEVLETKVEPLGGKLFRIEAKVINRGYLPTMTEMGRINRQPRPVQIEIDLPEETDYLIGSRRARLPVIAGAGGVEKTSWLVRLPEEHVDKATIRAFSPLVGEVIAEISLSAAP